MIIKQTRIGTGGAARVVAHVNNQAGNELCEKILGSEEDLFFAETLARAEGRKYCIRHFSVSPDQELTGEQLNEMLRMIGSEFAFRGRDVAVYKHVKKRANGTDFPHFHILVSEQDASGKTMSNRMNYVRNEKLARAMELKFGHSLVKGAHNRAVAHVAPDHVAQRLSEITTSSRPQSAFGSKANRKAERFGLNLPAIIQELKQLSFSSNREIGEALGALEGKFSIHFEKGDRRNVILIKTSKGETICNANRSLSIRAADVSEVLAAKDGSATSDLEKASQNSRGKDGAHRADPRSSPPDQHLPFRSGRSIEYTSQRSAAGGPSSAASGSAGTDCPKSNWSSRGDRRTGKRDEGTDRSIQLVDRGLAKKRLASAATRVVAKNSLARMRFGNETSSEYLGNVSSGPEPISIDSTDPMYAEKVLDAWRRSMRNPGPRL